jgi:hypothetical protein
MAHETPFTAVLNGFTAPPETPSIVFAPYAPLVAMTQTNMNAWGALWRCQTRYAMAGTLATMDVYRRAWQRQHDAIWGAAHAPTAEAATPEATQARHRRDVADAADALRDASLNLARTQEHALERFRHSA